MHYQMLACDYDGTLAEGGVMSPDAEQALRTAKNAGVQLGLVTGRILEELFDICPQLDLFDLVVAENGAVLHLPGENATEELGPKPPTAFETALDNQDVRYSVGRVMIASKREHEQAVRAALDECGLEHRVILNKDDLMVLPPNVDKSSGIRAGLERLGISADSVVGVGDAENDLELFDAVGLRVAVANALDVLKERADVVLDAENGAGVAAFVREQLLAQ